MRWRLADRRGSSTAKPGAGHEVASGPCGEGEPSVWDVELADALAAGHRWRLATWPRSAGRLTGCGGASPPPAS
jgi:hypothetical protein